MKSGKLLLRTGGIIVVAAGLIGLAWYAAVETARTTREQALARTEAVLSGQALAAASQVERQITAVDQMLIQMVQAWQAAPDRLDVTALRRQALTVDGVARDVIVTDATGMIRQSTLPDAVGLSIDNQAFFTALAERTTPADRSDRLYLGAPTISRVFRQWHINAARALRTPDGAFAGTVDSDYRLTAITGVLEQANLGAAGIAFVVGLGDGRLRGLSGQSQIDVDTQMAGSPLFGLVKEQRSGIWTGRSPIDTVTRIHAYRWVPAYDLAVVVAMDEQAALGPALAIRRQVFAYAGACTVCLIALAWLLQRRASIAAAAAEAARRDAESLAFTEAERDVFRAVSEARSEQLAATLAGAGEGICIIDGQMRLVEWNDRFAGVSGIAADSLRVGMPLEDVLRAQVAGGMFGTVEDDDAEISQRMARLRVPSEATVRRQTPDGRTLEVRRRPLPDGGFITFYADVSDLVRREDALRQVRDGLEQAVAARQRLIAAVIGDARRPLAALQAATAPLTTGAMTPEQRGTSAAVAHAGAELSAMVGDIAELRRLEAGEVTVRPTLFDLRPMLDDVIARSADDAAAAGVGLRCVVSPALPTTMYADAALVRQLLRSLVGIALRAADGTDVVLEAQPGRAAQTEGMLLLVRTDRARLGAAAMRTLFEPPPANAQSPADALGCALRASLAAQIAARLQAGLGCEAQAGHERDAGCAVWLSLPPQVLPIRSAATERPAALDGAPAPQPPPARRLPRTRVLLVEADPASRIVVATLLRRDGHMVDVAASAGDMATVLEDTPYDIILMDLMAQGRNGPAAPPATRAVAAAAGSVPLVALVGELTDDDAIELRNAGFVETLTKPVDRATLLAVISRCVWHRHTQSDTRPRSSHAADDVQPMPAVLATERLQELRNNLSPETFVTLIEECLTDLEAQIPALRQALASDALGAVVAHAHAMVGMAGGYGMASLEAALRSILNAARAGDRAALGPKAMARVEAALADVSRALREMMQDVLA